jgi:LPPG:FO 2-phospho-L-lactate transferase
MAAAYGRPPYGCRVAGVVLLSGGTGGAKLARGFAELGEELTVVANTGDDTEVYGVHVSPDPDLVTYWLAGEIDERGWGLRGDSFAVMDALEGAGRPAWFHLGDRDLAMCLIRTESLRSGQRLTEAHAAVVAAMGVETRVLPMADEPVATWVRAGGRTLSFQEYMIVERASLAVEDVELRGIERARPTDEVLLAVAEAELVVIGPSNPVISIGPILALPGMREAISAAPAPVIAVSPFVDGRSVKGPSEAFCAWAGIERSAAGIERAYSGLIDGLVADEPAVSVPSLVTGTLMDSRASREQLAQKIVEFGRSLEL